MKALVSEKIMMADILPDLAMCQQVPVVLQAKGVHLHQQELKVKIIVTNSYKFSGFPIHYYSACKKEIRYIYAKRVVQGVQEEKVFKKSSIFCTFIPHLLIVSW